MNPHSKATDEELVDLVVAGSGKAFEVLYNRYFPKVMDKCHGLLKKSREAEEFAEDILSKAYERLPSFQKKSSFSTWLYSITYNHCIDYLRKKKHLHYPNWDQEQEFPDIAEEETELEELTYEKLELILDQIHPEEKAILWMKYMDELSLKQISETLRITETATKMRLKRARTRVLSLYEKKYRNS